MTSHCGRRLFTPITRSPSQTCHAKPKLKSTGADATSFFPVGGMPTASGLFRRLLSEKSGRCAANWGRGALWLIVVISVRQSTRCSNIRLHCRALVMVSSGHEADSLIAQNSKKPGRTVREIDVSKSRDYLRSVLSASSSACHGLLIITVITPLPTKPSATKMPENLKLANALIMTCRCTSAWCCCARYKIHEGVSQC